MKDEDVTVEEFLKEYRKEKWARAKRNENVEVKHPLFEGIANNVILNTWHCDTKDCATGIHISGWKIVFEYRKNDEDEGWTAMAVGDDFCSSAGTTYIPDNWEHHFIDSKLSGENLLNMTMKKFWEVIEEHFNVDDIEKLDEHNKEQKEKYKEEFEQLVADLKEGRKERTTEQKKRLMEIIKDDKNLSDIGNDAVSKEEEE